MGNCELTERRWNKTTLCANNEKVCPGQGTHRDLQRK